MHSVGLSSPSMTAPPEAGPESLSLEPIPFPTFPTRAGPRAQNVIEERKMRTQDTLKLLLRSLMHPKNCSSTI